MSAFLTLSIISALLSLPLIVFGGIGLSIDSRYLQKDVCENINLMTSNETYYSRSYTHDPYNECSYSYERNCCISEKTYDAKKSATTCYGFQIFVALVQAGVAIAASAMSCRILCCSKQDNVGGVVYLPGPNPPQQFMMVAPNQFSNPQQFVTAPSNQVAPSTQVASPVVMQQNGNILIFLIGFEKKEAKNTLINSVQLYNLNFDFQDHQLHHMNMKIKQNRTGT